MTAYCEPPNGSDSSDGQSYQWDYWTRYTSIFDWRRSLSAEMLIRTNYIPGSKVHGANMGPTWGRQDQGGPHVGPVNFDIWDVITLDNKMIKERRNIWCFDWYLLNSYTWFDQQFNFGTNLR